MVKHKTLAFFIPHLGCPHRCSFCDQRTISGVQSLPTPERVAHDCEEMRTRTPGLENAEIAFFGGSFTAVDTAYQTALLEAVQPFLGKGNFDGVRISTRPDAIDPTVLERLRAYHVTAVELGAQSMSDVVLQKNGRGHTAQAVRTASAQIRAAGFSLGLQQMTGLYGSTLADEYETLYQLLACQPETLRIYPTVVLKGTDLAQLWGTPGYPCITEEEMLDFCADALDICEKAGVRVIRLGLHDSPGLHENVVGGYYHPAYREMVESRRYLRVLLHAAQEENTSALEVVTERGTQSKLIGQHAINRKKLADRGISLLVRESAEMMHGFVQINGKRYCTAACIEERREGTCMRTEHG